MTNSLSWKLLKRMFVCISVWYSYLLYLLFATVNHWMLNINAICLKVVCWHNKDFKVDNISFYLFLHIEFKSE
jgi:hypothetical protein